MKNKNSIRGMHDIRTISSLRKGSSNDLHNTIYIDLYMLSKEEKRLLEEKKRIEMRLTAINTRLLDIEKFQAQVQVGKQLDNTKKSQEREQKSGNNWNIKPMRY